MERPGSGGAEGAWAALLGRQQQQQQVRAGRGGPGRWRERRLTVVPAGPGVLPGGEQPALRVRDRALLRGDRLLHLLLRAVVVLAALDHPHPLQLLLRLPAPPGQAAPAAAAAAAGDQPHRLPRCLQLPRLHDGPQAAGLLQAAGLRGGGPPAQHAAAAVQRHPGPAERPPWPPGLRQPHALAQLGELHQLLLRVELRHVPQQHVAVGAGDGRDGAQPRQHAQRGGRHQQHQLGAAPRGGAGPGGTPQTRPVLLHRGLLRGRRPPLLRHRGGRGGGGWRGTGGRRRQQQRAFPAPAPDGGLGHRGGTLPGGGGG
ncbi:hypothetical protein Q9966_012069 [Columba livia]|nr:hypothetical protein Q9966_012069 [Columba livia]